MPRKTKDAPGRVTPKGGTSRSRATRQADDAGAMSGRYTAPIPKEMRVSPPWYPWMVLALFVAGILVIILNYVSLLGGHASNWYLLIGLGLIVAGFVAATRWH
jgi:hypothetical protein